MRRTTGVLLASLLAVLLLVPATTAAADEPPSPDTVVLAIEGGAGVEAPGPAPRGPNATDNPAAPREYEANYLWGASVGILVLTVLGIAFVAALYLVLVVRPRRRAAAE